LFCAVFFHALCLAADEAVRHGDFLFTQDGGRDTRRAFWLAAVNSQKETGSGRRAWEITGNHSADKEKTV